MSRLPPFTLSLFSLSFFFLSLFLFIKEGEMYVAPRYQGVNPTTTMKEILNSFSSPSSSSSSSSSKRHSSRSHASENPSWGYRSEILNVHLIFSMRSKSEVAPRFMCGIEGLSTASPEGVILNLWLIGRKEVYEDLVSFALNLPFENPPKIHYVDLQTFFSGTLMEKMYTKQSIIDMINWFNIDPSTGLVAKEVSLGNEREREERASFEDDFSSSSSSGGADRVRNRLKKKKKEGPFSSLSGPFSSSSGIIPGGIGVPMGTEHPLGRFWVTNLCNAARLLIMHKIGGMYIDLDFFVLKDPRYLPDGMGYQGRSTVNGAALVFRHPGFPWLQGVIENFVENYNGNMWGNNGPLLMSRSLGFCNRSTDCKLDIWPKEAVYSLSYSDFESYGFEKYDKLPSKISDRFESIVLKSSLLLHFWNKVIIEKEKALMKELKTEFSYSSRLNGLNQTIYGKMFVHTCPLVTKKLLG